MTNSTVIVIRVLSSEEAAPPSVMSPSKESAPDPVEAASPSTADIVNTREYGKLDLRAIKVRRY